MSKDKLASEVTEYISNGDRYINLSLDYYTLFLVFIAFTLCFAIIAMRSLDGFKSKLVISLGLLTLITFNISVIYVVNTKDEYASLKESKNNSKLKLSIAIKSSEEFVTPDSLKITDNGPVKCIYIDTENNLVRGRCVELEAEVDSDSFKLYMTDSTTANSLTELNNIKLQFHDFRKYDLSSEFKLSIVKDISYTHK